jgi:hypothetical protein
MSGRLIAILVGAGVLAPLSAAQAAHPRVPLTAPRGDLLVTFSGTGGGSYRYHVPMTGGGASCRTPETTYTETDAYRWSYSFVLSPGGGTSDTPFSLLGGGSVSSAQQEDQCGALAANTSVCRAGLRTPLQTASGDLAYPGVNVAVSGRLVTVGAVGELVRAAPGCTGIGTLLPNLVTGYTGLQATVSVSRAELIRDGVVRAPFSISGSGLYAGVALSGSCSSTTCDTANCATDASAGPLRSCSFGESYSGVIEIRIIR